MKVDRRGGINTSRYQKAVVMPENIAVIYSVNVTAMRTPQQLRAYGARNPSYV